jgi:glutamate-1-semialdehyde 2,1-aminomutase
MSAESKSGASAQRSRPRTRSRELFARAQQLLVGGVNSPVRAFGSVGGEPVIVERARGSRLWDADGNEYLDYVCSWGALILGHADPDVVRAVAEQAARGTSYGMTTEAEAELAARISAALPSIEKVRLVSSGTEATMSAVRLARAATGRDFILKFEGCYHGHADSMLLKAGSGLAEAPVPDSAGLAPQVVQETLIAPLDDSVAVESLFDRYGREIAAVIIEPLPANHGLLPQRHEFLERLARSARAHGALLIFDEVISGFRLGFQGYAGLSGITPDLVTYGKVIGGGFPVGAYGGRRELMELVAPSGPVYQAGTLSANPLAMCAGLATLQRLADGRVYQQLEALGARLEQALASSEHFALQRVGSIFWPCYSRSSRPVTPMRTPRAFPSDAASSFAPVFHALLGRGVYLAPSAFEVGFLSAAHSEQDIDTLAVALRAETR